MAKSKKTAPPKKAKSEEMPEVDTAVNDTAEIQMENESEKKTQENGEVDVTLKKKGKPKSAKKDDVISEDEVAEEAPVQENGDGDAPEKKKPAAKKTKTAKKAVTKPATEPARKSSRAPKPVTKEDDQAYEVEALIDFQVYRGKSQYLVRWKGYSKADDTWEDEASLNCSELLQKYKADHPDAGKKAKKRSASKSPVKTKQKKIKKVEKDYEVEEIVNMRVNKKGKREFRIRWKGYKPSDDSWEPESNLSCKDLINKYLEETGDLNTEEKKPRTPKKAKTTTKSARGKKSTTK